MPFEDDCLDPNPDPEEDTTEECPGCEGTGWMSCLMDDSGGMECPECGGTGYV